jgi:hypothetical protein
LPEADALRTAWSLLSNRLEQHPDSSVVEVVQTLTESEVQLIADNLEVGDKIFVATDRSLWAVGQRSDEVILVYLERSPGNGGRQVYVLSAFPRVHGSDTRTIRLLDLARARRDCVEVMIEGKR